MLEHTDSAISEFREYLLGLNRAPATVRKYVGEVLFFLDFLARQVTPSFLRATVNHMESYQAWLLAAHTYSGSTVETKLKALKCFYRWLLERALINHNPLEHLPAPKLPRPDTIIPLSEQEVARLLAAPNTRTLAGARDRAILEVFYSSGVRLSELCGLEIADAATVKGLLRVRQGKGRKDRVVPIGRKACIWIEVYLRSVRGHLARGGRSGNSLFLGVRGKPIHYLMVERMVRSYAALARIEKRVTPHVLRHTCATRMLANGADVVHVQQLLGHAHISTTRRYVAVSQVDVRAMQNKYHPREHHAYQEDSGGVRTAPDRPEPG